MGESISDIAEEAVEDNDASVEIDEDDESEWRLEEDEDEVRCRAILLPSLQDRLIGNETTSDLLWRQELDPEFGFLRAPRDLS